jgi:riboflavin synthase
MFTGLVDDVGTIEHVGTTDVGRDVRVRCRYTDLTDGESIAVNGACLTVRTHGVDAGGSGWFVVSAIVTTLDRTTIADWAAGRRVNLERAMRLGDRLGGHLVLGHVDDLGTVIRTETRVDAWLIDVELPAALRPLMVSHGSITVDGVSLTVNALQPDGVQLSIIDYTMQHTTLGDLRVGDRVHVEADVLAKHVERLLAPQLAQTAITVGASV